MEVIGVIEQMLDKSNPPLVKKVVVIRDQVQQKNKWCVELRKQLSEAASILKTGDHVKITFYNDGRIDSYNNHYNNIVAEKIERI